MVNRMDDIVVYDGSHSYTDPGNFVRIWNYGTPEFQEIAPMFEHLSFSKVNRHLASLHPSDRGNQQDALGFSTQNLKNRCPQTNVAIPALNEGTDAFQEEFAKLSTLAKHLNAIDDTPSSAMDLFRWAKFAGTIHSHNMLEGN